MNAAVHDPYADRSIRKNLRRPRLLTDISFPVRTVEEASASHAKKMELLKSAGLKTFDETPTPYVTLTPQQPHVAGRGTLSFIAPFQVDSGINDNIAEFRLKADFTGWLSVRLNFESKGTYLVTFTVYPMAYGEFIVREVDHSTEQRFLDKKSLGWQRLTVIAEVADPGNYYFTLKHEARSPNQWYFGSCDVTIWKK